MTEIFDVVDQSDQVIGQATRTEVHGNPSLIHRTAHVLVFNSQNKLYLQKRSMNKDIQPGKWDTSVGGHLDAGETYLEAAFREMKEELGITPDKLEFLHKYIHGNDVETEFVSTYQCSWDGGIVIEKSEIDEGRFWDLTEIDKRIPEGLFTPNFVDELKRYRANGQQK